MHLLYPVAKRYIAGEDLPTAIRSIGRMQELGFQSSVDLLGEQQAENSK